MPSRTVATRRRTATKKPAPKPPVAKPQTDPPPNAQPLAELQPGVDFSWEPIADLLPWAGNPKEHDIPALMASLKRFGLVSPAVIWRSRRELRVGHGRLLALAKILESEPGFIPKGAPAAGVFPTRLFEFESEDEADAYALADNRLPQLAGWNAAKLTTAMERIRHRDSGLVTAAGWSNGEVGRLLAQMRGNSAGNVEGDGKGPDDGGGDPTDGSDDDDGGAGGKLNIASQLHAKAMMAKWGTAPGQLWEIPSRSAPGQVHRIFCGDCTREDVVRLLFPDDRPRLVICDPPYCSGGFQEAQKAAGTFGTIANDNLSTKGYMKLIRTMLAICRVEAAYVFTDWRMWTPLSEVVEESSLALRSMLVWDKMTPGMGQVWRTQHELIMYGCKTPATRRKGVPAVGNVLRCRRTGNKLHVTEKPVDLLRMILVGDAVCERKLCPVYDAFSGSGGTLVACELEGRVARNAELEPGYVGTQLERAAEMGLEPRLVEQRKPTKERRRRAQAA